MDVYLVQIQLSLSVIVFTLCKGYIIFYWTYAISNDAKLNMADGGHKDFRGPYPRHF
jgi:hypothetical protein